MLKVLNFRDIEVLKNECNRISNWTDGGRWMGTGKEPRCSISNNVGVTHEYLLEFHTDEAVLKWNKLLDDNIRFAGHAITVLISALTSFYNPKIAAVIAIAIGKDELQAAVKVPKVLKGWELKIRIFRKYLHDVVGNSQYTEKVIIEIVNISGVTQFFATHNNKYNLNELNNELFLNLASGSSFKKRFSL